MLLKDDKKGLVTIIMKKMKGHGDMSPSYKTEEKKEDYSSDNEMAQKACCDGIINAIHSRDGSALKRHLSDFLEMMVEDQETDHDEM